jgi:hypothetical protein
MERKCQQCGVEFERQCKPGKNGSFCTRKCRDAAKIRLCENCGDQFHSIDGTRKTCSQKCRLEQVAKKNSKDVYKDCKWCEKPFSKTPSELKAKKYDYCCSACVNGRRRLKAWMRGTQKAAKAKTISKRRQWQRLCENATALTGLHNESVSEWERRIKSAVSCNTHRLVMDGRPQKNTLIMERSWEDLARLSCRTRIVHWDAYRVWRTHINNTMSNHRKRMIRKTVMQSPQSNS